MVGQVPEPGGIDCHQPPRPPRLPNHKLIQPGPKARGGARWERHPKQEDSSPGSRRMGLEQRGPTWPERWSGGFGPGGGVTL
jgi:hypothetical protein